jgi:hypothetical protein
MEKCCLIFFKRKTVPFRKRSAPTAGSSIHNKKMDGE